MNVYFVSIGDRPFVGYVVASWKTHEPKMRLVQITDLTTIPVPGVDVVIRHEYARYLMVYMINAFSMINEPEFITINDDCVLGGPLGDAIEGDFDVAIVKRVKPRIGPDGVNLTEKFKYTNGLVVVKNQNFYKDCLVSLLQMETSLWDWFGDMAAIRDVIDSGQYKVKFLPEDRYCKIPTKLGQQDPQAILWHYSGDIRKGWIQFHAAGCPTV